VTTIVAAPSGAAVLRPEPDEPTGTAARGPRDRVRLIVLAALVVGFALRLAIGLTDDAASTDETAYAQSGESLVAGDGFARDGHPELHFPPLLPLAVGLADGIVDDPHTGVVALTVLSSTALIVPLSLLGRRVAGPVAGAITAWVAALMPGLCTMPQIRGTGSEAEYTLLVVSAVWIMVSAADRVGRARLVRIAGSGLLAGLAYLTRPEGLFVAIPLGLAVVAPAVRDRRTGAGVAPTAAAIGAFALPLAACVVPYAAYQHAHTGSWQLSGKAQDASIEAWQAVARGDRSARNAILYDLDETGLAFSAEYSSLTALARDDPAGHRAIVRTNADQLGDAVWDRSLIPAPLWLLAAFGAWAGRRSRTVWLLLAVGALPVVTALVFFVQQRYLLVTLAFATVMIGVGIARLPRPSRLFVAGLAATLAAWGAVVSFRGDVAGWWHPVEQTEQRLAGEWLAGNTAPGDRVMTRSMIVDYYAERTAVALPHAPLADVLRFADHYGARYLVADWYTVERLIPELSPLLHDDPIPGLRLIHEVHAEGRDARIFELDPVPSMSSATPPALGFVGDGS
jgi:Dolichyl-phosphate-mannose-protein mannosyltransferase